MWYVAFEPLTKQYFLRTTLVLFFSIVNINPWYLTKTKSSQHTCLWKWAFYKLHRSQCKNYSKDQILKVKTYTEMIADDMNNIAMISTRRVFKAQKTVWSVPFKHLMIIWKQICAFLFFMLRVVKFA